MGKIIGLDALQSAVQGKLEPRHETQTVTGTNGTISISNALNAPFIEFSATGMGTPQVFSFTTKESETVGAAMGSQTWDNPMILDVPVAIVDGEFELKLSCYGNGIGSNTFSPTAGTETGTLLYYNSKEVSSLFDYADEHGGTVTDEGTVNDERFYLCTIPLPFSVEANSTVYCSHLQNKNVSGEEGIWASGSTLYVRAIVEYVGGELKKFANVIKSLGEQCNFHNILTPAGYEPQNFCDFFIMLTASANYTKVGQKKTVSIGNGTSSFAYCKVSDYVAYLTETTPNPTTISSMSATYLVNSAVNAAQSSNISNLILNRFCGDASLGDGAYAEDGGGAVGTNSVETNGGGAVGTNARSRNGGSVGAYAKSNSGGAVGLFAEAGDGGAVGEEAYTKDGGAVGGNASSSSGGAVGYQATASSGGAVGYTARSGMGGAVGAEANADSGGAVGSSATATTGCAIGDYAKASSGAAIGNNAQCIDGNGDAIDALQLGQGTNSTAYSMQVYSTTLLTPTTAGSNSNLVIPPALLTASVGAMTELEKTAFKSALGIS